MEPQETSVLKATTALKVAILLQLVTRVFTTTSMELMILVSAFPAHLATSVLEQDSRLQAILVLPAFNVSMELSKLVTLDTTALRTN